MAEPAKKDFKVCNKRGLHARAAAKFVTVAGSFSSDIKVAKEKLEVSGRSIMGLLLLAAGEGEAITISADGRDAKEAVMVLGHLVESGFYESD